MTTLFADSPMSVATWILIKASILLGVATLVQMAFGRRASAATRHRIWMLGLTSMFVLPVATAMLPQWPLVIHVESKAADVALAGNAIEPTSVDSAAAAPEAHGALPTPDVPSAFSLSPSGAIAGIYLAGVAALLLFLVLQRRALRHLARSSTIVNDADWIRLVTECAAALRVARPVRLLRSRERNVPMAFGTRRPSIVIPAIADTWDDDRRRAVLLHELAHVARYDCLTQMLTAAVCAMYWFHPAVWWTARRVRIERELACDDRVIAVGTGPREYAGHLLEIAYSFGGHRAPALAVTMARPRQLEGRMLAALDSNRNRQTPSRRTRIVLTVISVVVLAALSAVTLTLDAAPPADPGWMVSRDTSSPPTVAAEVPKPEEINRLRGQDLKPLWDSPKVTSALRRVVDSFAPILQENAPGTWEVRPSTTKGMVHLRIVELNSSSGTDVAIEQLEGLTGAQLTGVGGPVQFKVRRDAGTFTFEGVIRNGVGAGTFSFTPDPNFPAELAKRGFARPTPSEQYQLARHDIGFAFVDELNRQGYTKPQTADLVRAGQHGVQATYLREMGALGYRLGTLDPLITLRDHGITPAYVREMGEQGYKGLSAEDIRQARDHGITPEYVRGMREGGYGSLSLAEIVKARDHGITPEYVRGMKDGGYGSLPLPELVNARDHGITPEFVRELGSAGYTKLPLDMLLKVRDHGVTPEYVREMKGLGYSLSPDELVRARDHGVTTEYVREMAALGYGNQPIDALIRVRDHGVTPEYARELKTLGYDKLPLDDLVTLRDNGLTAERIRSANSRAGTKLPIDLLKSLAR